MSITDKPTLTVAKNGTRSWRLNGKLHRTDGPADEDADGSTEWWLRGNRHRIDGPAVEYTDGSTEWWLNGEKVDAIVHFLKVGKLSVDKS